MKSILESAFELAQKEIGEHEIEGSKHNERILEYHKATTLKATSDEVPWCSSFVNWCIERVGGLPTRSAMARSWLTWGHAVETPVKGDIVILTRGMDGVSGHVGFLYETPSKLNPFIKVLGGNQDNQVSVKRYPRIAVLGYRRS